MADLQTGTQKLCVAYDVVGYSKLSARSQASTQSRLARLLDRAFGEAGPAGRKYEILDQGDGGVAVLAVGPDEPRSVIFLARTLETGLAELNEGLVYAAQIRLRVSVAKGVISPGPTGFVGRAVIEACCLRDSAPLRRALAESNSCLAVALTDSLYREMQDSLSGNLEFRKAEFSSKDMAGTARIYLAPRSVSLAGSASAAYHSRWDDADDPWHALGDYVPDIHTGRDDTHHSVSHEPDDQVSNQHEHMYLPETDTADADHSHPDPHAGHVHDPADDDHRADPHHSEPDLW